VIRLVVAIWAGLAEGGDGCHHQAGVDFAEVVVIQPQLRHSTWGVILHQYVGVLDKAEEDVFAGGGMQVQGDPLLAGVEIQEQAAAFGVGLIVEERGQVPRRVTFRRLDLYHLGAEVGQQLGAVGAGYQLAQLDDLDPAEC